MIWLLLLFYLLVVVLWGIASFFAMRALHQFGFVGDATLRARRIYLFVSVLIIISGFLAIILS